MIRQTVLLLFFVSNLSAQTFQQKPILGRQINGAHPLAKGLVGIWIFNEGSGNKIFDLSGNANNGTLTAMIPESDWISSTRGSALDFDGVNDYVDTNSDLGITYFNTTWSATAWFNVDDFSAQSTIVGWGRGDVPPYYYWMIAVDTSGKLEFWAYDGTNRVVDSGAVIVLAGRWHHVAAMYDNGNVTLYMDGARVNSGSVPTADRTDSENKVRIGYYTYNTEGWYLDGLVDDVRIYNRALATDEVQQLYRNSYAIFVQPNLMFMLAQVAPTPAARRRVIVVQ